VLILRLEAMLLELDFLALLEPGVDLEELEVPRSLDLDEL